jgi:endonuclease/exonuclease/phosphatase family metal-dependent hydrolase
LASCGNDASFLLTQPEPRGNFTVANLNILHGIFCPPATNQCRLPDRVDLTVQWVESSGCPDVVTFQEVTQPVVDLFNARLTDFCGAQYALFHIPSGRGVDDVLILTRHPVVDSELRFLRSNFRHVVFARIDHPLGLVDVFSTHLAASGDGGPAPCLNCPAECAEAGAMTNRECQAVQVALFVEEKHDIPGPAAITGDFNEPPDTFAHQQFVGRGWLDTYRAVGNPECDPLTGIGCTSGRIDDELTDLESPENNVDERIDYIFLVPPAVEFGCEAVLDSALDEDGDGTATRIFADLPNPFSPTCGPLPDPICWPSDHEGSEMDLNCF